MQINAVRFGQWEQKTLKRRSEEDVVNNMTEADLVAEFNKIEEQLKKFENVPGHGKQSLNRNNPEYLLEVKPFDRLFRLIAEKGPSWLTGELYSKIDKHKQYIAPEDLAQVLDAKLKGSSLV